MKTMKMILSGLALSMLAIPVSADLTAELPGCRNLDDMGKKTVVQFESPYRLMDFCSGQMIERMLMSNPDHWLVEETAPPNIDGVRGFFTVQPTNGANGANGANGPYANNVIIYLEDGTRRELWLQMLEKRNLMKGLGEAFLKAYEIEVSHGNTAASKAKQDSFMEAYKKDPVKRDFIADKISGSK